MGEETLGGRLAQAVSLHPRAPAIKHGRLTWLQRELHRESVDVALETVRKWMNDEVTPRAPKLVALSRVLNVDLQWLTHGGRSKPQQRLDARGASGAVLSLAGALELAGIRVGFLGPDDPASKSGAQLTAVLNGKPIYLAAVPGTLRGSRLEFPLPEDEAHHVLIGVALEKASLCPVLVNLNAVPSASRSGRTARLSVEELPRVSLRSWDELWESFHRH